MSKTKKKILDFATVNKIKLENVKEFTESIFSKQYENALISVKDIINNNGNITSESKEKIDPEICNVVPFLGGRGTGKTSAMFSFYVFLKNYAKDNDKQQNEFSFGSDVHFLTLDPIYASMLGNNEGVLEAVLASMWNYYSRKVEEAGRWSDEIGDESEELSKEFADLKNSYQVYLQMSKQINLSTTKQLHDLSSSMNFRSIFQKFVKKFLKIFSGEAKNYLVIAIDDIDMAGKNSFHILEQLHLFLCVPNIIILLTADMARLQQICGNYFLETYAFYENKGFMDGEDYVSIQQDDLMRMRDEFVSDYLGKIIASNLRVNMPDWYMLSSPHNSQRNGKDLIIKDEIIKNLLQYNMEFDGYGEEHHFLEESSLRGNVNLLKKLTSWHDNGNEQDSEIQEKLIQNKKEYFHDWMIHNIQENLIRKIESLSLQRKAEMVFKLPEKDVNKYLIHVIGQEIETKDLNPNNKRAKEYLSDSAKVNYRLSEVLYGCSILEEIDYNYKAFVNFVLAYYTVMFPNKKLNEKSIWGNWTFDMVDNLERHLSLQNKERYFAGIEMSNLKLEINVKKDEIEDITQKIKFDVRRKKNGDENIIANSKMKLKKILTDLLNRNKEDIIAFQTILSLFDVSSNKFHLDEGNFFEFKFEEIYESTAEAKIQSSSHETTSENQGEEDNKDKTEEAEHKTSKILEYKIVISPLKSIFAEFNFDYPLIETEETEKLYKTFRTQLIEGLPEQIIEIVKKSMNKQFDIKKEEYQNFEDNTKIFFMTELISVWKQTRKEKCQNRIPIENVQMIYNIGTVLKDKHISFEKEFIYNILRGMYSTVSDELKERDNYFKELGIEDKNYEEAFSEYPIIKIFMNEHKYGASLQKILASIFMPSKPK